MTDPLYIKTSFGNHMAKSCLSRKKQMILCDLMEIFFFFFFNKERASSMEMNIVIPTTDGWIDVSTRERWRQIE